MNLLSESYLNIIENQRFLEKMWYLCHYLLIISTFRLKKRVFPYLFAKNVMFNNNY